MITYRQPRQIFDFTKAEREAENRAEIQALNRNLESLCTLLEHCILQSATPPESGRA